MLTDPLGEAEVDRGSAPDDGLPVALTDVIARYRNRYFKLKLGGDVDTDLARLRRIAEVLESVPDYRVTLDGNDFARASRQQCAGEPAGAGTDFDDRDAIQPTGGAGDARSQVEIEQEVLPELLLRLQPVGGDDFAKRR